MIEGIHCQQPLSIITMNQISSPNQTQLSEIIAAAPDAIAHMVGAAPAQPHPLAGSLRLIDLAYACGRRVRQKKAIDTHLAVAGFGLGTSDFSGLLAQGLVHATVGTYDAQAAHMAFCTPVAVENFHEVSMPSLDADMALEPLAERAELTHFVGFIGSGAVKVQLRSYGRKFGLSRTAIINNDLLSFARLVLSAGTNAARLESRLVATSLESNPALDDALNAASLGTALSYLRTQKTEAGQLADLAGKHLVVEPALEMAARDLVRNAGLEITVTVLAHLPTGRWYLAADPAVHPVVGVLRLANSKKPIRVERAYRPKAYDGTVIGVVADLGACILRRTGVVRGGTV
jgi:hypothetical protein